MPAVSPAASFSARSEPWLTLDAAGTKLNFLRHAYPLLEPLETIDGVRLMSVLTWRR